MRRNTLVGIGLGIVAAAGWLTAAGAVLHYRGSAEPAACLHEAVAAPQRQPTVVASASQDRALAARDARIAELEALLDDRDELVRELQAALTGRPPAAAAPEEPRRGRGGPGARTEGERTTDPQAEEERARRREEFRQQVEAAFSERMEALKSRDTSAMSDEDRDAYALMVQLIEDTWRLGEQVRSPELPREERRAVMEKLRANIGELRPMMDAERTREFTRIGTSMGYDTEQAAAFATHLNDVIETTSMRWLLETGMRAAFGGGGRRWGGGRDEGRDTGASTPP